MSTPNNPVRPRNLSLSPDTSSKEPINNFKISAKINSITDQEKEKYKIKTYAPLLKRFPVYVEKNQANITLHFEQPSKPIVQNIKPKAFEITKLEPIKPKKGNVKRNPFGKYVKKRNRTTIH